ncbi:Leucine-rich repeat [Sesbania bispinosa]|nr:Leucine-rich repeat [Sesbania bispinosa]
MKETISDSSLHHSPSKKTINTEQQPITNFFNLLTDELIFMILDHLDDDPFARTSFSQLCKSFHSLESTHRRKLKPRRLEFLPTTLQRYPFISSLDFSLCPCVDDDTLNSVSLSWSSSLRSINLSGSRFFTHVGLSSLVLKCSNLVEIDLSNRTDLTDSAAKAIAEAANLERLWLARCKSITDMGIACIAVKCTKLRSVGLRWCIRITDFGVGLIAIKCKEIQSLDLSYLPITEKCLSHILQLKHLEDLVLEHCLGIDDEGLATLQASCESMKMLNLSKCQNISHIGLTALTNGAQNLEKLILSNSLAVTNDLAMCLQSFPRLQLVKVDGCAGTSSGLKAIGTSCASVKELNLCKCVAATDETVSFLVQTLNVLEKLDITCCRKITHASIYSITNSCTRLTSLRMESCSMVNSDAFILIGQCQLLEELDATDTEIDDEGLESISRCTKLSSLKLGICLKITDNGLKHIASRCSELKYLDLYRSSRITDEGITAIAHGCSSLEVINIAYNSNVTDASLVSLSKCQKLKTLEIRGCRHISSVGLSNIAVRCRHLEKLDIKKCHKINDTGMIQLAQYCQNLKQIKLSHCSVTDVGLIALANIGCLQHLCIFNLEGLTSNGLAAVFLSCQNLTKMKLNTSYRSLLPQYILDYMEARGCVLVWREKVFDTFRVLHMNR